MADWKSLMVVVERYRLRWRSCNEAGHDGLSNRTAPEDAHEQITIGGERPEGQPGNLRDQGPKPPTRSESRWTVLPSAPGRCLSTGMFWVKLAHYDRSTDGENTDCRDHPAVAPDDDCVCHEIHLVAA